MVSAMILEEAERLDIDARQLRRLWLHQANAGMNRLIAQRVLGHEANDDESPTVLDTYGNTSSAGSIIAFHLHQDDLVGGDTGLICSFGAGYSAGTVFVRKVNLIPTVRLVMPRVRGLDARIMAGELMDNRWAGRCAAGDGPRSIPKDASSA